MQQPPSFDNNNDNNPILIWWINWQQTTPFATKYLILCLTILGVGFALVNASMPIMLSNIPVLTIFHYEFYRLFTAMFVLNGFLDYLLTVWMLSTYGTSRETKVGSFSLVLQLCVLSTSVNVLISCLALGLAFNPIPALVTHQLMHQACGGMWMCLYALLVMECCEAPNARRSLWPLPCIVPAKSIPWILLGFQTLLVGFQWSNLVSMGVGYLYAYGWLDWTQPSVYTLQRLECGRLQGLTRLPGYVSSATMTHFNRMLPFQTASYQTFSTSRSMTRDNPTLETTATHRPFTLPGARHDPRTVMTRESTGPTTGTTDTTRVFVGPGHPLGTSASTSLSSTSLSWHATATVVVSSPPDVTNLRATQKHQEQRATLAAAAEARQLMQQQQQQSPLSSSPVSQTNSTSTTHV